VIAGARIEPAHERAGRLQRLLVAADAPLDLRRFPAREPFEVVARNRLRFGERRRAGRDRVELQQQAFDSERAAMPGRSSICTSRNATARSCSDTSSAGSAAPSRSPSSCRR
jgi:hypothetical protein